MERLRSESAEGLEAEEVAADDLRVVSVLMMVESGLSLDLNRSGSDSSSESSAARRRFFLSAIWRVGEAGKCKSWGEKMC